MLHCETTAQFKAYQWIKTNFEIEFIELKIINSTTIQIKDSNNETANIQFKNNKIIIEYENHKKQIFNLIKEPCR
jgi:hypothetical protein